MATVVTLIPGDGIGAEITENTVRVLEAGGADVSWDRQVAGVTAVEQGLGPLPDPTIESVERNRVVLKGPLTTPVGGSFRSINVALRKRFDLYANVRPGKTIQPTGRYDDVDLVLIRENTEGLYVGIEHYIAMPDDPKAAAESAMIITRAGSERIVRFAFEYARRHGRRKVTLAHKANILKCTQGLLLEVARNVAEDYAGEIEFEDRIVDAAAMQLVLNPAQFDVIVTENMFGDILSDLVAGLIGGLGLAPGANIGRDVAMFEPVHGSAPDIAGQRVANPAAQMLAGCLLLEHLGQDDAARRIRAALNGAIHDGGVLTRDLGGSASTDEFTDAVIAQISD